MALLRYLAIAFCAAVLPMPASAHDVPKEKATKLGLYVTAKEAFDTVEADRAKVLFLDIRTRSEVQFVGYTSEIDALVPFVEMSQFGEWDDKGQRYKVEANPVFSQTVEKALTAKGLTKADKVILMCRSGDRSAKAADKLAEAGFTQVYSQIEGFEGDMSPEGRRSLNGWKNAGLPWTYKLDKAKVFQPLN